MRYVYPLCLALAGATSAHADETPLTFEAAVARALERAPQVQVQGAALDSAEALRQAAGRLPDPAAIVGIDNVPVEGPEAWSTTRDFMTMQKIGVMLSFPSARRRAAERTRAEAEIGLAQSELVSTRADVAREAGVAWLRFAASREAVARLQPLESDLRLGADAARASLKAGRGSAMDALAAEAAVVEFKSRMIRLQGDARRAEAELARWIGADAVATPAAIPSLDQLPADLATLREATHLHVAIAPLDARIEVAQADLDMARAARRPGWNVELAYARRGPDYSDMASLQFTVDLPIFARNRQDPVIEARSADLRRARAERETELAMHAAELQQMVISWEQFGEQLHFLESEQLPLARERARAALGSYRAGQSEVQAIVEAVSAETGLELERSSLIVERGMAWAYLNNLRPDPSITGSTP